MFYRENENDADGSHEDGGAGEIDRGAYHKDFETLELSTNATPDEVTEAYQRLKEAYSPELISMSSPVGYAIEKKRRQDMIGGIEAAYRSLQRLFAKEAPARPEEIAAREDEPPPVEAVGPDAAETGPVAAERPLADIADFSGQTLKEIRENLNISLEWIYEETRIRIPTLENIETENFPDLPPEVYVKGFVKSFARCLSLDPIATVRIYMEKYHEWQRRKGGKKHRQQHHAPFRFSKKKGKKGEPAL